ncbi:MAG: phosphatidylinositol-specific phospholipase C1-like protein [Ilumatobacter sp.]
MDELRLNEIQVIGSHNSYHLKPQEELFAGIAALSPELASGIEYSHAPLTEQLDTYGIRQFEIDIFADPVGGLYANRASNEVVGLDPASGEPALDAPGYKVMHTQDFDYESTCLTLVSCLSEIEAWSSANPTHVPVMIMLEFKEQSVPEAAAEEGLEIALDLPWAIPVKITPELLQVVDAEIASVFGPERIITPDDVRGDADTLEAAVLDTGWPTVESSRGKVMFSMTDGGAIRDMYVADAPSIEGRPIFTTSSPGQPDAAFVRLDDPTDQAISPTVEAGYLVRTRTDSPTDDARSSDTTKREAALESGAHFLSTDYYRPSEFFESDYVVEFSNGVVARCNPVTAPATCDADQLVDG